MLIQKSDREGWNQFLGARLEYIRAIAYRISSGEADQAFKSEFVDDSCSIVVAAITKQDYIDTETFRSFCSKVLQNDWISRTRRRRLPRLTDMGLEATDWEDARSISWLAKWIADHRLETFSPADVARIERWPPRACVVVLGFFGFWHMLPMALQQRRLREVRHVPPFPPEPLSFEAMAAAVGRNVASLRKNVESIKKMVGRNILRLLELDYIKSYIKSLRD
jgi:DNA-directed RNA polymerase specialized sigma24 family protein